MGELLYFVLLLLTIL